MVWPGGRDGDKTQEAKKPREPIWDETGLGELNHG